MLSMSDSVDARPVVWVRSALEAVCAFPPNVRARVGCELFHLCTEGPSRAWLPIIGAPGANAFLTVVDPKNGKAREAFRVACVTWASDVVVVDAFARKVGRGEAEWPKKHASLIRARLIRLRLDRAAQTAGSRSRLEVQVGQANPFLDVGFAAGEANDLLERTRLLRDLRRLHRRSATGAHSHAVRDALNRGIDGNCVDTLRNAVRTARTMDGG